MTKTLNLKISAKEFARMLNVHEMDIITAEQSGGLFQGVELPKKTGKGYKIGEALEFIEKLRISKLDASRINPR